MKLEEGKLILTEDELAMVKRASMLANPIFAGTFLKNSVKQGTLEENVEEHDSNFYVECVQAYRQKNYEIK